MWKLIRLEMKKNSFGWYFKGAIIANLLIILLMCFIVFIEKIEGNIVFSNLEEIFIVIGALVRATFIIFAAVLIAKLIIEEYKNKTIFIMFTYPISRKKLIACKLLITCVLTFMTIAASNVFIVAVFLWLNSYLHFIPGALAADAFTQQVLSITAFAFAAAGTSLIPLYFGMRKHSVPATIVSSIIIVALISNHNPEFSIASIIYIPLFLAAVGVIVALRAVRNIEKEDVI